MDDDWLPGDIPYKRGEEFRLVEVQLQSTDGGTTWTRVPLTGLHYARDIRQSSLEPATLLLAIRDDDDNAYARLEHPDDAVTLTELGETTPSSVGVIVTVVPRDVAVAALPVGAWPTDHALVDSTGNPVYVGEGRVVARARVTVVAS